MRKGLLPVVAQSGPTEGPGGGESPGALLWPTLGTHNMFHCNFGKLLRGLPNHVSLIDEMTYFKINYCITTVTGNVSDEQRSKRT